MVKARGVEPLPEVNDNTQASTGLVTVLMSPGLHCFATLADIVCDTEASRNQHYSMDLFFYIRLQDPLNPRRRCLSKPRLATPQFKRDARGDADGR